VAAGNNLDDEVKQKESSDNAFSEGQDSEDASINVEGNAENVSQEEENIQAEESASAEEASGDAEDSNPVDGSKEGTGTPGKKEKRFGRKKDKNIEKLEEKLAELEDRRVRQLAEFENFRKRSEKEKSQMFETGAKTVVEKILPVIDNFERGLAGVPAEEKEAPFVQGVELVYKQLVTALNELGVKPIDAVGKEFDPNLHNAVMHVEDENLGENVVAQVFQAGFMLGDKVIRFAMVQVAN